MTGRMFERPIILIVATIATGSVTCVLEMKPRWRYSNVFWVGLLSGSMLADCYRVAIFCGIRSGGIVALMDSLDHSLDGTRVHSNETRYHLYGRFPQEAIQSEYNLISCIV